MRWRRVKCGPSYQNPPETMSGNPSLLTSKTPADSKLSAAINRLVKRSGMVSVPHCNIVVRDLQVRQRVFRAAETGFFALHRLHKVDGLLTHRMDVRQCGRPFSG